MAKSEDRARDEAIAWHLRLDHADEGDWDVFLTWIGSDPENRLEFDRAELAGAAFKEAIPAFASASGADPRNEAFEKGSE